MTGDSGGTADVPAVEPMEWTVRLWEAAPGKRWVVLVVALGAGALGWAAFSNVLFALVGFVAILGATSEHWMPLRYKLDGTTASVRCGVSRTSIEWTQIKRVVESDLGVRLSPLAAPTRLAPFRGVYLRYAGNRDVVLEYVKKLGGDGARVLEPRTDG